MGNIKRRALTDAEEEHIAGLLLRRHLADVCEVAGLGKERSTIENSWRDRKMREDQVRALMKVKLEDVPKREKVKRRISPLSKVVITPATGRAFGWMD